MTIQSTSGPDGRGWLSKLVKLVVKGGDIGATFKDVIDSAQTLVDGNASAGEKTWAAISIVTEALPLSVGDVKSAVSFAVRHGDEAAKGAPKPSPNFKSPTNPAQDPPTEVPPGWRVRRMPPTEQYPHGYWRLEKPMSDGSWQPIDPSTMRPGSRAETHVPLPPKGG